MRPITLVLLLILTAGCSSPAVFENYLPSASPRAEWEIAQPTQEAQPRTSGQAAVVTPPEMGVPLVAWDSGDGRYELLLADPATGYLFPEHPAIGLGGSADYVPQIARSPDGGLLAVTSGLGKACETAFGGLSCWPSADTLRLIDLRTWRETETDLAAHFPPAYPPFKGWASNLVFSRDALRLALAYTERDVTTLALFDARTGALIAKQPLDVRPRLMDFSADGSSLAVYGSPVAETRGMAQPDPPSALLLDAVTLEVQWRTPLPAILDGTWCRESCAQLNADTRMVYWSPAVVFDPVRNRLHIVHADEDRLTTVDLQGRSAQSLEIRPALTWIEQLLSLTAGVAEAKYWPEGGYRSGVLLSDGRQIYTVGRTMDRFEEANGEWTMNETSLGLTVIEADSGHELGTRASSASRIRSSLDHRYLILDWGLTGSIEVLEAETLELVGEVEGWEFLAARRIDGQGVFLLASQTCERFDTPTRMAMLAPEPFEFMTPWSISGSAFWISPP
jgi:hypothetical protein